MVASSEVKDSIYRMLNSLPFGSPGGEEGDHKKDKIEFFKSGMHVNI